MIARLFYIAVILILFQNYSSLTKINYLKNKNQETWEKGDMAYELPSLSNKTFIYYYQTFAKDSFKISIAPDFYDNLILLGPPLLPIIPLIGIPNYNKRNKFYINFLFQKFEGKKNRF